MPTAGAPPPAKPIPEVSGVVSFVPWACVGVVSGSDGTGAAAPPTPETTPVPGADSSETGAGDRGGFGG
ncbi:hypothetical protein, partial [Amycolatopsis thermalba]|uniref:hypothetical protein n=1 Tax=Amycolatopsis thermalba TaxID=944492 RepID=UPI001ABFC5F5